MGHGPDLPARGRSVPHRDPPGSRRTFPTGWFDEGFSMTPEERKAPGNEEWTATLFEGGWICATWPKEYGGKGLTTMEARGAHRGVRPGRRPAAGRLLRRHARRARPSSSGAPRSRRRTSCPRSSRARSPGARASPSPTPAPTSPASGPRPCSTATSGSSTARRSGPPRASSPTTSSSSAAPTPTPPSTRASPTCCAR